MPAATSGDEDHADFSPVSDHGRPLLPRQSNGPVVSLPGVEMLPGIRPATRPGCKGDIARAAQSMPFVELNLKRHLFQKLELKQDLLQILNWWLLLMLLGSV